MFSCYSFITTATSCPYCYFSVSSQRHCKAKLHYKSRHPAKCQVIERKGKLNHSTLMFQAESSATLKYGNNLTYQICEIGWLC